MAKVATSVVKSKYFIFLFNPGPPDYLATFTALFSRMTVTLIWPG